MERAIDDRGDPPAGDRVLAQLEQAGRHAALRPRARAERAIAAAAKRGSAKACRAVARSTEWRCVGDAVRRFRPSSRGDRGRVDSGHAARIDELEVGEVDGHVERDAVIADAALDAQAERADLARRGAVGVAPSSRDGRRDGAAVDADAPAQVSIRAASSARTNGRSSRPRSCSRMIGYATSWPGPW